MLRRRPATLLVPALLVACENDTATTTPERDTVVAVAPEDFMGEVPCAEWPGAMQAYVATLIDVTEELVDEGSTVSPFTLPSSPPVSCGYPVGFGRVVIGHRYVARVDGYDLSEIEPAAPGSQVMVDAKDGSLVSPRWSTQCGKSGALGSDGPTTPLRLTTVYVTGCDPLDTTSRPPLAAVRVRLDAALTGLDCSDEGGSIDRFEVRLPDSEGTHGAQCGEAIVLHALGPGELIEFDLVAFEADATEPRWHSNCSVIPRAGTIVEASCEPLSDTGAIEINVATLAESLGISCDSELDHVTVALADQDDEPEVSQPMPPCGPVRVVGVPGGPSSIELELAVVEEEGLSATCTAEVVAGEVVQADCEASSDE